jgi:hypothetical protein
MLTTPPSSYPIPDVLLTSLFGTVSDHWVAVSAGAGAAVGNYQATWRDQRSGEAQRTLFMSGASWILKYCTWRFHDLAFTPKPFFDNGGWSPAHNKCPSGAFLLFCSIGKILKMLMLPTPAQHWGIFHLYCANPDPQIPLLVKNPVNPREKSRYISAESVKKEVALFPQKPLRIEHT